jgi:hypothetical protein
MQDLPPAATRLMPMSIRVAPGLIQSLRIKFGVLEPTQRIFGTPGQRRQIALAGVGDGHGRVLAQQLRQRIGG